MKLRYNIATQEVVGKTFAVLNRTGEPQRMLRLEGVAPDIIRGLQDGLDEDAIIDAITAAYAIDRNTAARDVHEYLLQLQKMGIVEP